MKRIPNVKDVLRVIFTAIILSGISGNLPAQKSELKIPEITLEKLDGEAIKLGGPEGRSRLLVFVKSYCDQCMQLLPRIKEIGDYFPANDLEIVIVAAGETRERAAVLGELVPREWIYADPSGIASTRYRVRRVPQAYFISQMGRFRPVQALDVETIWGMLAGDEPAGAKVDPAFLKNFAAEKDYQNRMRRLIIDLDDSVGSLNKRQSQSERVRIRRDQLQKFANRADAHIIHNYGRIKNRIVVEIDENRLDQLKQMPGFRTMKEDIPVHALLEDTVYQIHANYAWSNAITGEGILVAVVDTGIDYNHPDLRNKVVMQYDATTGGDDAMDDNGHGTHVAGIIASQGIPYRGVSYDVALMGVKVLDYGGAGYASDVILGIEWAVANGADVINLSLGEGLYANTCDATEMAQVVNAAVDAGVVVICASGNDGNPSQIVSPACASKAIAVGSVDKMDGVASYSDGGLELDLVAPGGDAFGGSNFPEIVAPFSTMVAEDPYLCLYLVQDQCYDDYFTVDNNRYIRAVGTSMAAPHVAGAAALLLEANPDLTPAQVKEALESSADDLGQAGWDPIYGWGRINLEKALDNLPAGQAELTVRLTEPNSATPVTVNDLFQMKAEIECRGGDGCGDVIAVAEYENPTTGVFETIGPLTTLSTGDANPVNLGSLSGITSDVVAPLLFDAQTAYDPSESLYLKTLNPDVAQMGSLQLPQYKTGDLEPDDALGAIGEDVEKLYAFDLPDGVISKFSVRMEHYMVIQFDGAYNGWYVYTSDMNGTEQYLLGDCIVPEGGGGLEQPPDCWWVSEDPAVLASLNAGGMNYILIRSHDVGSDDWLTFNDIEVIVDYEPDPTRDEIKRYVAVFDLSGVDPNYAISAARLDLNIETGSGGAVGEVYLVNNGLELSDSAEALHDPGSAYYSSLNNPIKTFTAGTSGPFKLNLKTAIEEALTTGQMRVAFQWREEGDNALFNLYGSNSEFAPRLVISQLVPQEQATSLAVIGLQEVSPASGGQTQPPIYDTAVTRRVTTDQYSKQDYPSSVAVGAPFIMEYNTGDLEPENAMGAIGEDVEKVYDFELPAGTLSEIRVRMKHYLVLHTSSIESGWYVYVSDTAGSERYLIDDCIPIEGGGGEAPPPDCWFILNDPAGLALFNPGETNYIKLLSHDVGPDDWLTFDAIELIAIYEVDSEQDDVNRYYVQFDLSGIPADAQIDSARLNLFVTDPGMGAEGEVHIVNHQYSPETGAYTIFNAEDASYTSLMNPYKTFAVDSTGLYPISVKPALEDALENATGTIAFLVTEKQENALFLLDGSAGGNPPSLDVYLKSGVTGASAQWGVLAGEEGRYPIRVRATGTTGVTGESDVITVNVVNPWIPYINSIECRHSGQWQDCANLGYGDVVEAIRVEAGDLQEIPQVTVSLKNLDMDCPVEMPDCGVKLQGEGIHDNGQFVLNGPATLDGSGQWQITARAEDSNGNVKEKKLLWTIPWGRLESTLVDPNSLFNISKGTSRILRTIVHCLDGDCPDIQTRAILNDAITLSYDDGSEEDYGTIGATEGYLAVKFTPTVYPAYLNAVRIYVYDETAYPFYLHVWDDNGGGGDPGTQMMSPLFVQPVVSSALTVGWYEVDLTGKDLVINNGSFYVGFSHISNSQLNAVGFDTNGPRYTRSWGYLDYFGGIWFNLNDYCSFSPEYCGNLMIRAILGNSNGYSGILPESAGEAPYYTRDSAVGSRIDLNAGDTAAIDIDLHAVGYGSIPDRLTVLHNTAYSLGKSAAVAVQLLSPVSDYDAANLDAYGAINLDDIQYLGQQWLGEGSSLNCDINLDQKVDILDLTELIEWWLAAD